MKLKQSIIILKGFPKPLECTYDQAERLEAMLGGDKEQIVNIENTSFKLGDIKLVRKEKDRFMSDMTDWKDKQEKADEERKFWLSKSPEEKAESISFFTVFYKCVNGNTPSEETLEEVRRIQKNFYKTNPRRMYCDPALYKHLLNPQNCDLSPFYSHIRAGLLQIIPLILADDIRASKYII